MDTVQILIVVFLVSIAIGYVHVFGNKKLVMHQKLTWAMVIFFIAPIGTIVYLVFGAKPKRTVKNKSAVKQSPLEVGHAPHHPYDLK